jgi:hypothetical protein
MACLASAPQVTFSLMIVREIRPRENLNPREALEADVVWFDWDLFSGRVEEILDWTRVISDQWIAIKGGPGGEPPAFWILAESLPIAAPKFEEFGVMFFEKSQARDERGEWQFSRLVDHIFPDKVDVLKEVPPSGTQWELDHEGYLVRRQGNTGDQTSAETRTDVNPYNAAVHFLDPDASKRQWSRF